MILGFANFIDAFNVLNTQLNNIFDDYKSYVHKWCVLRFVFVFVTHDILYVKH